MGLERYFSESYEGSRKRFLDYNKDSSIISKEVGGGTIDVAIYEPKNKKNLLMLISGLHGIEGSVGSAFQNFFVDNYLKKLNKDTSLCLIHALNPFGFKYGRRVNENNVDLNRAFIDKIPEIEDKTLLEKINEIISQKEPLKNFNRLSEFKFYGKLLELAKKYSYTKIRDYIVQGQYTHQRGLFYGGNSKEEEVNFYKNILKQTKEYDNLVLLDMHSGVGERYEVVFITEYTKNSRKFQELEKIFPNVVSGINNKIMVKNKGENFEDYKNLGLYDTNGSLRDYTDKSSQAKNTYCLTLEFGTISELKNLYMLAAENQVYHYGSSEKIKRKVKKEFLEAFYPSEEKWRKNMLEKTNDIIKRLGEGFLIF